MYSLSLLVLALTSVASAAVINPTTMHEDLPSSLELPIHVVDAAANTLDARGLIEPAKNWREALNRPKTIVYRKSIAPQKPIGDWRSAGLSPVRWGISKRSILPQKVDWRSGTFTPIQYGVGERDDVISDAFARELDILEARGILPSPGRGPQFMGLKGIARRSAEDDIIARETQDLETRSILPPPPSSHFIWRVVGKREEVLEARSILPPPSSGPRFTGWKGIAREFIEDDLVARDFEDVEIRSIVPHPKGSHFILAGVGARDELEA